MLPKTEALVLNELVKNGGTAHYSTMEELGRSMASHDLSMWRLTVGDLQAWRADLLASYHSLKDKGLLSGDLFDIWRITDFGVAIVAEMNRGEGQQCLLIKVPPEQLTQMSDGAIYLHIDSHDRAVLKEVQTPLDAYVVSVLEDRVLRIRVERLVLSLQDAALDYYVVESVGVNPSVHEGLISRFTYNNQVEVSDNIDSLLEGKEDSSGPNFVVAQITKRIRDTTVVLDLKRLYNYQCQVCGITLRVTSRYCYAEAHHIVPLGRPHLGPDIKSNLIVVCPNHHVEFDSATIALNPSTLLLEHANRESIYHTKKLLLSLHQIDNKFLQHHYRRFLSNVDKNL